MYAIIQTGGKQYKVEQGDVIYIEKLSEEEGTEITFDALLIADGEKVQVGTPTVDGASVKAKVLGNVKGKKIVVYKFKPKKNYRKKTGHRQPYTKVEILSIG